MHLNEFDWGSGTQLVVTSLFGDPRWELHEGKGPEISHPSLADVMSTGSEWFTYDAEIEPNPDYDPELGGGDEYLVVQYWVRRKIICPGLAAWVPIRQRQRGDSADGARVTVRRSRQESARQGHANTFR